MNILGTEQEKDFCSINSENADLLDESETKEAENKEAENKEMLDFVKETLGIANVVISKKLKTHPVCLSSQGNITLEMEKYFASLPDKQMGDVKAERVLELNSEHKVFGILKNYYENDKQKAEALAKVLYSGAQLIAGMPIEDPSAYTELICSLL